MSTATDPYTLRQSTLATFSRCPLSARFEIEAGERHAPELARGSLFHEVMERCLRALHAHGGEQIPQAEALEIMYGVLADEEGREQGPLVLPPAERAALRQIVVRWASDRKWNTAQIMGLEKPLRTEIVCPDGVVRVLTGTPDVLIAEPPDEVVIYDAKSGWGPPATPRGDQEAAEQGENARRYLTERGHYQLDAYGLLVMREYPSVQKATLWEDHPRVNESRKATLHRDELEHVERLIGIDLMLTEQGTRDLQEAEALRVAAWHQRNGAPEGSQWLEAAEQFEEKAVKLEQRVWKPVPGKQCAWCLRPRECPRAAATRGEGAIDGPEAALEFAMDVEPLTARRDHTLKAAKAWVDAHGPIPLPDGRVLGWEEREKDGKVRRSFCAHHSLAPVEDDTDWAALMGAQAEANREARG